MCHFKWLWFIFGFQRASSIIYLLCFCLSRSEGKKEFVLYTQFNKVNLSNKMARQLCLLIALTLFLAAQQQVLGFFGSNKDPIMELSDWLEKQTSSSDILDNIDVAEKAKLAAPNGVRKLIDLRVLAERVKRNWVECNVDEIAALRAASGLINKSRGNPYTGSRQNRRLNKIIIELQGRYIPMCIEQMQDRLKKHGEHLDNEAGRVVGQVGSIMSQTKENLSANRYNKMASNAAISGTALVLKQLDSAAHLEAADLISGKNLVKWTELLLKVSGRKRLCDSYPNNKCVIERSTIKNILDHQIWQSCQSIDSVDNTIGETMYFLLELVRDSKLEPNMLKEDVGNHLLTIAAGLKICRAVRFVDWEPLTDDLAKFAASKKL